LAGKKLPPSLRAAPRPSLERGQVRCSIFLKFASRFIQLNIEKEVLAVKQRNTFCQPSCPSGDFVNSHQIGLVFEANLAVAIEYSLFCLKLTCEHIAAEKICTPSRHMCFSQKW
jgi:hypothetical protein